MLINCLMLHYFLVNMNAKTQVVSQERRTYFIGTRSISERLYVTNNLDRYKQIFKRLLEAYLL